MKLFRLCFVAIAARAQGILSTQSGFARLSPILTHVRLDDVPTSLARPALRLLTIPLIFVGVVHAQQTGVRTGPASVSVHGQAALSVDPDQAQFDIGVVTQASTAKAAADQNSTQSNALIKQLGAAFPSAGVRAINFSVNPNYQYPRDAAPAIVGYTATNTVRLLLDDVSKLRTVIDIAIASGANSINRLAFSLHNETSARAKALGDAATQARDAGQALASALNLRLGRLISVEEGQPVVVSLPHEFTFENLQSTNLAPISVGTIDVHADVELTYELMPASQRSPAKVPSH